MPDSLHNLIGQVTMVLQAGVPTALSFPPSPVDGVAEYRPKQALISVEGAPVRWGMAPSFNSGQFVSAVPPNNLIDWTRIGVDYTAQLQQVKFLAIGGQATLQIQYLD